MIWRISLTFGLLLLTDTATFCPDVLLRHLYLGVVLTADSCRLHDVAFWQVLTSSGSSCERQPALIDQWLKAQLLKNERTMHHIITHVSLTKQENDRPCPSAGSNRPVNGNSRFYAKQRHKEWSKTTVRAALVQSRLWYWDTRPVSQLGGFLGFPTRRPRFNARWLEARSVMHETAMKQVFLLVSCARHRCSTPIYHCPMRCAPELTEQYSIVPSEPALVSSQKRHHFYVANVHHLGTDFYPNEQAVNCRPGNEDCQNRSVHRWWVKSYCREQNPGRSVHSQMNSA
jgi:hypothetical protein